MSLLTWIIFGAIAGWLASILMKSDGSLVSDIVMGIIGAMVGGWVFNALGGDGVTGFNLYSIIVAVIGASIIIFLGRLIRRS